MDDEIRRNQRSRANQIYREDDRESNRRRQANEHGNEDNNMQQLLLSLSLGPTSYSSQISPTSASLPLAPPLPFPPPMTTWSSLDLAARMTSSSSYFMMSPPYLTPPPSIHPGGPSVNFFPPSNQTQSVPLTSAEVEPRRSFTSQSAGDQNSETIPPPFPWAANKRGKIQSLDQLESKQITTITGDVQCKHCEKVYEVSYNLREKFSEVANIFVMRKRFMRERALKIWINPEPARCELCGREKAVKPVIAERKSKINWLFLLLGQTLGYCTLEQLKNFCKHAKCHRTGAKNRVLYLTYLVLCKMLQPDRQLFNYETLRR